MTRKSPKVKAVAVLAAVATKKVAETEEQKTESPFVQAKAGPLTAIWDRSSGFLRQIRLGDHEVIRGIYGTVRDAQWATVTPVVTVLREFIHGDSFEIEFEASCQSERANLRYRWTGLISGDASGKIAFSFDGIAESSFLRNRIGLCLLHPILECAGKPCTIEHGDGTTTEGVFSKAIAPQPLFTEMTTISHEAVFGATVKVQFEGGDFEMEDQRNWTDHSYKTYCPPVSRPIPVETTAGETCRQRIEIVVETGGRKILPVNVGREPQVSITTTTAHPIPLIGTRLPASLEVSPDSVSEHLDRLNLNHLRVDLLGSESNHPDRLVQADRWAQALNAKLHIALHSRGDFEPEFRQVFASIAGLSSKVELVMPFNQGAAVTSDSTLDACKALLSEKALSETFITRGTTQHFADLNRHRPDQGSHHLPAFPITPQVHAFDDMTLIENALGQGACLETLATFCPRSAVISPITLLPIQAHKLDQSEPDSRQFSLFNLGWTLASLAALSTAGNLHSLTYFELSGASGLFQLDHSGAGNNAISAPVSQVFGDLVGQARLYPTAVTHPDEVASLALLDSKGRKRILVSNLTPEPRHVRIKSGSCNATVKILDGTNLDQFLNEPSYSGAIPRHETTARAGKISLSMNAYAYACVDIH